MLTDPLKKIKRILDTHDLEEALERLDVTPEEALHRLYLEEWIDLDDIPDDELGLEEMLDDDPEEDY